MLSLESRVTLQHCPMPVSIPLLGYGTYLCSSEEAASGVSAALKAGYRHIDTAEYYNNHEGIARAIAESGLSRDQVFLTDKISPGGLFDSPERTFEETKEICLRHLRRLQTEYIDLYLLHHAFAKNERINQYKALMELQKEGFIRAIGVSNWNERHINELSDAGLPLPSVNQIELHPLCTQEPLVRFCRDKGVLIVAYSSLAPLSSWRVAENQASAKTAADIAPALLAQWAAKYGKCEAQILLRWTAQQNIPILPKSVHEERIRNNANIFDFEISSADMEALSMLNQNKPFAWPIGNPLDCP